MSRLKLVDEVTTVPIMHDNDPFKQVVTMGEYTNPKLFEAEVDEYMLIVDSDFGDTNIGEYPEEVLECFITGLKLPQRSIIRELRADVNYEVIETYKHHPTSVLYRYKIVVL